MFTLEKIWKSNSAKTHSMWMAPYSPCHFKTCFFFLWNTKGDFKKYEQILSCYSVKNVSSTALESHCAPEYWNLTFLNQLWNTQGPNEGHFWICLSINYIFQQIMDSIWDFSMASEQIDSPWTFFKERKSFKFGTKCGWVILFKKIVKVCWKIEGTVCLWPWTLIFVHQLPSMLQWRKGVCSAWLL